MALVIVVEDGEEARRVYNNSRYELSAAVIRSDFGKGWAIAERLQTSKVHINDSCTHDEPQGAFGGVKDSGWGMGLWRNVLVLTAGWALSMQQTLKFGPWA